jgi:hypothetical protein
MFGRLAGNNDFRAGGETGAIVADYDAYVAQRDSADIYIVPRAAVAAAPAIPRTNVTVAVYNPQGSLSNWTARLASLSQRILAIAAAPGDKPDFLIAPEYFYNQIADREIGTITEDNAVVIVQKLAEVSAKLPKTAIVAGSVAWTGGSGSYNSSCVFYNGGILTASDHRRRYDKSIMSYENEVFGGHRWKGGNIPYLDFSHPNLAGLNVRLQICADTAADTAPLGVNLKLVVSSSLGQLKVGNIVDGGMVMQVDGQGYHRILEKGTTQVQHFTDEYRVHTLAVPRS